MSETTRATSAPANPEMNSSGVPAQGKPLLEVTVAVHGTATVIRVVGEATYHTADRLQLAIMPVLAKRPSVVIVDLAGATLFSSLAIAALVNLRRSLARWGGTTKLAALPPHVRQTLEVTKVLELFEVFAAVEQAMG